MKGLAGEMIGNPFLASECYKTALLLDPRDSLVRQKAIDSLIVLSQYLQAIALCADGKKFATNRASREFFDKELAHCQELSAAIAKDRPCTGPRR
jgi:hypothetical protein